MSPSKTKHTTRKPMSPRAPVSDDVFNHFVDGAGGASTSTPPPAAENITDDNSDNNSASVVRPMLPSQMKAMKKGPGRKKKMVRPWLGKDAKAKERMTLIIEVPDKIRLDFLHDKTNMPAQSILRSYIEDALRQDAEALFLQLYPESADSE